MARVMINRPPQAKKMNRSITGNAAVLIILVLMAIFMSFPLIFAIVNAFKPLEEFFLFPPRFFVQNPTTQNFVDLLYITNNLWVPFSRYIANSVLISVVSPVGHVILASMAAYPLAKTMDLPGRKVIFNIVILSLLFSNSRTISVPQYMVMSKIGLVDSQLALILPSIAGTLGLFLMKQFMEHVPDSTIESAKLDGASELTIFWNIIMPSVKPAWLTLGILAFQHSWNAGGATYIYSEQLKTLPVVFNQIAGGGIARRGVAAAAGLIMMLTPIITFVITQSNLIDTMASSGLKD